MILIRSIKNKIDTKLPKGGFARSATTLMTGNVIAQAVLLSTYPLVTRLYTPGQFGTYALFTSIFSVLSTVATMRYELAIMLPEKDDDAVVVFKLSTLVALAFGLLSFIVVLFFNRPIVSLLNNPEIGSWLYFIPLMIVLVGLFQNARYWLNRNKRYRKIAIAGVIKNSFKSGSQIGLATVPSINTHGLIIGTIISQTVSTLYMLFQLSKKMLVSLFSFKVSDLVREAKKYKKFPIINAPHSLLNSLSENIPVALFSMFFSNSVVGFYSISMVAVTLPITLISSSVGEVFYQRFNKAYNRGERLDTLATDLIKTMLKIALVPALILFAVAPYLFSFVFGHVWVESGQYTRILAPWAFMIFVVAPLSYIPLTLGYQKKSLVIEIVGLTMRVLSVLIGVYFKSIYISLILFSLSGFCVLTYTMFWVIKISKKEQRSR